MATPVAAAASGSAVLPPEVRGGVSGFLVAAAVLSYVVATALGVVIRFRLAGGNVGIPFDHLLHAHSHTLYFGWLGLCILYGAIGLLPSRPRLLTATAVGLAGTVPAILGGFLVFGYHPLTIAISTTVMLGWYLAVALWWRAARTLDGVAALAIRAGFGYLVAASLGVWTLAALQASEAGTPLGESLAVHAFLLGFGWFVVLAVVGLIAARAPRLGLVIDERAVRRAVWWWAALAWITFPLGVVGGPEVPWLGPAARLAGLALLYPGWVWVRCLWQAAAHSPWKRTWRAAAAWFALTTLTMASVAVAGSDALNAGGRQGVVIHLHALFVGFITISLVLLLAAGRDLSRVLGVHSAALGLMLIGLAGVAAGEPTLGMRLAAGAAVVLWGAGVAWSAPLIGHSRR